MVSFDNYLCTNMYHVMYECSYIMQTFTHSPWPKEVVSLPFQWFLGGLLAPQAFGLSGLQRNPTGLTGTLGATGTSSLGNPFGSTTGLGSTNLPGAGAFGSLLNTNTLGTTGLGTTSGLTTGFGTPALGTSTGGVLGSSGTGLGGSTFGAGTSAFSPQPKFQLQRPPSGNKRGKRRWKKAF